MTQHNPPSATDAELMRHGGELAVIVERLRAERQAHERTARQFYRLMATWKTEVRFLSNINEKCSHSAYQQIIEMGQDVVPLILDELRREPDHWFAALRTLTGENPVPPEARGKPKEMTLAWLEWAEKHGYSQGSGTGLPESEPGHRSPDE
jgi:hypothetical protein